MFRYILAVIAGYAVMAAIVMTTPADKPYGKGATGSKYQGQRGPTPSRYFENFKD